MADNNCKTCRHRESGDDAYHCYMFKEEPTDLCMQHQDRRPKRRVGVIGHVGGRTTLVAAVAAILARQAKDGDGVTEDGSCPACKGSEFPGWKRGYPCPVCRPASMDPQRKRELGAPGVEGRKP